MADELKLKTNKKSTFWNEEMAVGVLSAAVFSMLVPAVTMPLALMAIGGVVGSVVGKSRMQHEYNEGKTVRKPSLLNRNLVSGGLFGAALAQMGAALLVETSLVAGVAFAPLLAITAAGALIGGYLSGNEGKARMETEYKLALVQNHISQGRARAPEQALETSVAGGKKFTEQLAMERALEQQQVR